MPGSTPSQPQRRSAEVRTGRVGQPTKFLHACCTCPRSFLRRSSRTTSSGSHRSLLPNLTLHTTAFCWSPSPGCLDTPLSSCPASGSRPCLLPGCPTWLPHRIAAAAPCSMLRAPAASPLQGTTMPARAPLAPTRSRLGFQPLDWRW